MADYESVLCVKNTVHVYRIPPRPSNRGYRAADWKLDNPDWTGRLRIVSKGKDLFIKLEDKNSGDLFAQCPVETYPGVAVEAVMDSSRYFVLRIKDGGGKAAFIGIGFEDRGDSFDLNVALQDHFKWLKNEEESKNAEKSLTSGPKLDLGFKEGQTIKINIGSKIKNSDYNSSPKARPKPSGGGLGFLPPPPGGVKLAAPPSGSNLSSLETQSSTNSVISSNTNSSSSNIDSLFDLEMSQPATGAPLAPVASVAQNQSDPWGEFAAAGSDNSTNWVQF